MILDTLTNSDRYVNLHRHFAKAFEHIKSLNLATLEPGKYEIDGKEIHAAISLKDGYTKGQAKFEAHNNYIDIQVCPSGTETIGWKPREFCKDEKEPYNADKDVIFYNDKPDTYFDFSEGQFAIFYPDDVHAPMIGEGPIKKLVIKVKL